MDEPGSTDEEKRAALEKGRLLFAAECAFQRGAAKLDDIPQSRFPEIAFAGRSNAGKSSIINALTGRNTLARVSNTPGRTQQINFFLLGGKLMLADLPGYGFAKVSKSTVADWTDLIFAYLAGRPQLRRVVLIIDSRRGIMENDQAAMTVLDRAAVSYQLVLTKTDKLKAGELAQIRSTTEEGAKRHGAAHPVILATSALEGDGIPELRAELAAFTG